MVPVTDSDKIIIFPSVSTKVIVDIPDGDKYGDPVTTSSTFRFKTESNLMVVKPTVTSLSTTVLTLLTSPNFKITSSTNTSVEFTAVVSPST